MNSLEIFVFVCDSRGLILAKFQFFKEFMTVKLKNSDLLFCFGAYLQRERIWSLNY